MDQATKELLERVAQIAESNAKLAELATETEEIKQVPIHKAKIATPFNPTGEKQRPRLRRTSYANGYELREPFLTNDEINAINQLTPGKYNDGKWIVAEKRGDDGWIEIRYDNKSFEARTALKDDARNLLELVTKILAEQSAPVPAAA